MTTTACELIVLCGGRGKRLNPITEMMPKALVPVRGRPIIDHVIDGYLGSNIKRVTFCVGYKGEQVREHFSQACKEGADYHFSDSGEHASMLQRIYDVGQHITSSRFIVAYCDTFTDLSPQTLLDHHSKTDGLATIVTTRVTNPFGIVQIDNEDKVQSFVEKPQQSYFIGTSVFERRSLELVDETLLNMPDGHGLVAFFDKLIGLGELIAYNHNGIQITFNTEKERVEAEVGLNKFYTLEENSS